MGKRRPTFNPEQLGFVFEAPECAAREAHLAGLDRVVASAVGHILKDDPRSRFEIAGGVSSLLDEEVTKLMLDAYASEARDNHNISAARFLALIAETQRYDVLDHIVRRIGCGVVVGEEIFTVELGHIDAQMERLRTRRRLLQKAAPEIRSGRKS